MSFRARVAALVALSVAIAFLVASIAMFAATRRSLLAAVDAQLVEAVDPAGPFGAGAGPGGRQGLRELLAQQRFGDVRAALGPRGPSGDALRGLGILQLVSARGDVLATVPRDVGTVPVDEGLLAQSFDGDGTSDVGTMRTEGAAYRVISARLASDVAVQILRPIDDIEDGLSSLAWQLALVSLAGVAFAFAAGSFVADRVLRPVRQLTTTAEVIAETQELAHRVEVVGDDELSRLGTALNRMLVALDTSRRAQQQLVADASHELRTPLTSLRTNVELLASDHGLGPEDRQAMRDDVVGQIEEMTLLIGNLVDLAREGTTDQPRVPVQLDEVVEGAVARQRRLSPQVKVRVAATPTRVLGDAARLDRAVANLLDNAVKYGGVGVIEVHVGEGRVVVDDHGPGVAQADRPHVFSRFWRSPSARGAPGSGLGLSIVDQVAREHGGTVEVADAPGGGARFTLALPTA